MQLTQGGLCSRDQVWLPTTAHKGSDPHTVRTVGINLSTRMVIIWRRGKTNVNRLLGNAHPETCTAHESTCRLPCEIVEMITAYLTRDLDALKTCSLTCRSWYSVVAPHLHHTLILRGKCASKTHSKLKPLSKLHELGLIPLVKEIRVFHAYQIYDGRPWFAPQAFSRRDLRYWSAFTNVQILKLDQPEIHRFIPSVERYFKHFSPTLRSITLYHPRSTLRQLSHFLSFFPNLDNVKILGIDTTYPPNATIPDAELVPFSAPTLRGQLILYHISCVKVWTHLVTSYDGLRFHYMNLRNVAGWAPVLLEACAETLETLRLCPLDASFSKQFSVGLPPNSS